MSDWRRLLARLTQSAVERRESHAFGMGCRGDTSCMKALRCVKSFMTFSFSLSREIEDFGTHVHTAATGR